MKISRLIIISAMLITVLNCYAIKSGNHKKTVFKGSSAGLVLQKISSTRPLIFKVLKLASIFSDHMVLQREKPVPIWGWANAGDKITVEFANQKKNTTADINGKWQVELDALTANAVPGDLFVKSTIENQVISIHDILVGEVWIASGQSNMTYTLSPKYDSAAIAAANHPEMRFYTVESEGSLTPQDDAKGQWKVCTSRIASGLTAVGYYFADELRKELNIPIGIIHSSVGGTQGESWVSREAQMASQVLRLYSEKQIDAMAHFDENSKVFQKALPEWGKKYAAADPGNTGFGKSWAKEDFNDADWQTCPAPIVWRQLGLKGGCVIWLRKIVNIPAEKSGKLTQLGFTQYGEDITPYFNGQELKPCWSKPPPFFSWWAYFNVPSDLVKPGPNVIALRIHSLTENGLMWRKPKEIIEIADQATTDDTWHYKLEARFPDITNEARASLPKAPDAQMSNTASALFNGKINPLIPCAMRGVIWYQGESNIPRAATYETLLTTLIQDWRTRWGQGDFPFLIVQLANYYSIPKEPGVSRQAEIREAQLKVSQRVTNTGLAVAIDIGEESIHPRNKIDVGHRLALQALVKTYGRIVPCSGPIYSGMSIEGQNIRITFIHVEGGLVAKNGPLQRFAIAGADKKFVWADAKIDGESVIVTNAQISKPQAVRYSWADNPQGCNLYNSIGLPTSPFRTDDK